MLMRPAAQLKRLVLIFISEICFISKLLLNVKVLYLSQCIEGVIGGTDYNQSKVNQWTASIVEHSLTHLVKQGRSFKYIGEPVTHHIQHHTRHRTYCWHVHTYGKVTMVNTSLWCFAVNCTIMQKSGAGLHTANSCYWDTATDSEWWLLVSKVLSTSSDIILEFHSFALIRFMN